MAIVYYAFHSGRNIAERYTPLVNATMAIKLEATTEHLWFEEAINGAKLGYWEWSYKTGVYIVKNEWLSILSLSRQDITNNIRDLAWLIHPDDKESMKKTMKTHTQSKLIMLLNSE